MLILIIIALQSIHTDILYRLKFQTAGLYLCKLTGLKFKMETAGELEYYSVPWGTKLDKLHYQPAGPLYNINCLQGTLVQIHFPHCEIISGERHLGLYCVWLMLSNITNSLFRFQW